MSSVEADNYLGQAQAYSAGRLRAFDHPREVQRLIKRQSLSTLVGDCYNCLGAHVDRDRMSSKTMYNSGKGKLSSTYLVGASAV